jgi:SAM-dependent methyltransferase
MSVSAAPAKVHQLIDAFVDAPDDSLATEFQRLTGALWRDGELTDLAYPAVAVLSTRFSEVDDRRKAYLAILLGLLAETEYPHSDGPVCATIDGDVEDYVGLLTGLTKDDPLCLALCYLLAHFPADRDRILKAAGWTGLNADDYSRIDRALAALDPENPVLGRVFPSPAVWTLDGAERDFDQQWIRALSPEQVLANYQADTRTIFGGIGVKAYWAVSNWASPAPLAAVALPPRDQIPRPSDPDTDLFSPHSAALRCPGCGGRFEFSLRMARCGQCAASYPIASGVLDLTAPIAGEHAGDFQFKLAEMPSMGLFYEAHARPNFLRLCGGNFDSAVTPASEDEYIAQNVRPVDGPVLDLAAGAGRWTEVLADAVGPERVIALDLNPPMLTVLRARLPRIPAIMASAATLPFEDASLGAVLCWNALQAFPADAPAAIAEVGRCLRPGGTFSLLTFKNSDDPVYRHFVGSHTFPQHSGGLHLFDLDELKGWLTAAGLRVREESGPGTFVFITAERPA